MGLLLGSSLKSAVRSEGFARVSGVLVVSLSLHERLKLRHHVALPRGLSSGVSTEE